VSVQRNIKSKCGNNKGSKFIRYLVNEEVMNVDI